MRYAVTVESKSLKKEFGSYNDARKFATETKKNWERQIEEMPDCERRDELIGMWFEIKIAKMTGEQKNEKH